MAQLNVYNKTNENDSRIGAIICHTPKTLNNEVLDGKSIDNRCVLIKDTDQLVRYFGNPFIDPSIYSDLIIAYNMVSRGIKVYISSLYDMKDNPEDGFNIQYNGYTEFRFKDKDNRNKAGYRLKSDIKFCQPIIQSEVVLDNKLNLYISFYIMDRHREKRPEELNSLEISQLFTTVRITFNAEAKDKDIVEALKPYGLELKIMNSSSEDKESDLIDCFRSAGKLNITQNGNLAIAQDNNLGYTYNLHNDKYDYDFSDTSRVMYEYNKSILSLASKKPYPHYVCISKLYKSKTTKDSTHITRSVLTDLDPDFYPIVQNNLLENFSDDSDTYLIISAPDISVSSLIDLLSSDGSYSYSFVLPDQFNCELVYGYAADYINSSLQSRKPFRVFYSAAILSLYNSLYNDSDYMTNSVSNLNISNSMVRSSIEEYSANRLADLRCNSLVLFDTGFPSIHGNRTQSTLPNLRHSHIARNMIRIRRLVREYLETKKFMLSTKYNIDTCINYIRTDILDDFKEAGILKDYTINYTLYDKVIYINISLDYAASAESIKLDFII